MIIIVGLGNPGKQFEKTRHNLGFRVLDEFRKENNFPKFKSSKKFESFLSKSSFKRKQIILAKPKTFMNTSGKAVKKLIKNYKLKIEDLIVIHDDLDLPLGKIKISKGRGSAGHKGVKSIIDTLGTKDFPRFRIGIKPDKNIKLKNLNYKLKEFVLDKFTKEEEKIVKRVIKKTIEMVEFALERGFEKAMQKYNK